MKHILTASFAIAVLAGLLHAAAATSTAAATAAAAADAKSATPSRAKAAPPPRLAVPDFIALSPDAETAAIAKTIGQVLWDDLNFEREFAFIPRDVYAIDSARHVVRDVPFDRWRELNADGLIVGTVQKTADGIKVEMRLLQRADAPDGVRPGVHAARTRGSSPTPASDELHKSQRALNGVARTRITFDSDRDGERMGGTVENRGVKEIYISDYDGENAAARHRRQDAEHRAALVARRPLDCLHLVPPRRREHLHLEHLSGHARRGDQGRQGRRELAAGVVARRHAASPSRRRATATRRSTSSTATAPNVRRLTNHPGIDITPTWSPSGTQIAFTSDRTGTPQIYDRRRRRPEPAAQDVRVVLRQADVVAGAVQRDRVLVAQRARLRHQGARSRHRSDAAADVRRGHQREPGVLAQRPPSRVHLHARRARRRCSRWRATARTCGRSRRPATTKNLIGPNS